LTCFQSPGSPGVVGLDQQLAAIEDFDLAAQASPFFNQTVSASRAWKR
jgi:hypothetical protein